MTSEISPAKLQILDLTRFIPEAHPKKVLDLVEKPYEAIEIVSDAGLMEPPHRAISPTDTARAIFMISQLFSGQPDAFNPRDYSSPEDFLIPLFCNKGIDRDRTSKELQRLIDKDRIYRESVIKEKFCNSLISCGEFINRLISNENLLNNYPQEKDVLKIIIENTKLTFSTGINKLEDYENQKDKERLEEKLVADIVNDIDNAAEGRLIDYKNVNTLKAYIIGCAGRYDDYEFTDYTYFQNKFRGALLKKHEITRSRFSTNTARDLAGDLYQIGKTLGFFDKK